MDIDKQWETRDAHYVVRALETKAWSALLNKFSLSPQLQPNSQGAHNGNNCHFFFPSSSSFLPPMKWSGRCFIAKECTSHSSLCLPYLTRSVYNTHLEEAEFPKY